MENVPIQSRSKAKSNAEGSQQTGPHEIRHRTYAQHVQSMKWD